MILDLYLACPDLFYKTIDYLAAKDLIQLGWTQRPLYDLIIHNTHRDLWTSRYCRDFSDQELIGRTAYSLYQLRRCELGIYHLDNAFTIGVVRGYLGYVKELIQTYPEHSFNYSLAFQEAVRWGHLKLMNVLCEQCDRNENDTFWNPPMWILGVKTDDIGVLQTLFTLCRRYSLLSGFDLSLRLRGGYLYACDQGNLEMVKMIEKYCIGMPVGSGLNIASERGHIELVNYFDAKSTNNVPLWEF
jgi:hypothetical protein